MPTVYPLIPDHKPQFLDSAGDPLSGGLLFVYTAGSSAKATTYTESGGTTPNANPIVLDSRGEPSNGVYVASGTYKLVLAPSTDTDPPASAIWTRDNLTAANDVSNATATEWTATSLTPTYVDATNFTLVGDQTTDHHVGRRVKATVSAGTVYGYISVSAFTSLTTVTVVLDSGSLDSGISAVDLGFLRADNDSAPWVLALSRGAIGTVGQILGTDGTDLSWGSAATLATKQATTSGTSITFSSIPSWVRCVVITFLDVGHDGSSALAVRLGDAGGVESTGYEGSATNTSAGNTIALTDDTALLAYYNMGATGDVHGVGILTLHDSSANSWCWQFVGAKGVPAVANPITGAAAGSKSLDSALTDIQITSLSGDTFDSGAVNLAYW